MLKSQIKANEYRGRALDASALAEASPLERVREKHELAAATWTELAALQERVGLSHDLHPPADAQIPIGASVQSNDEDVPCTA